MLFEQITSLYKEIKEENNFGEGLYERRLLINSHELGLPVFLGISIPGNLNYFSFVIPKELSHLIKNDQTSGLKISLKDYDELSLRLYISLENLKYLDIFIRLAEDLISFIIYPADQKKIIAKLSIRLNKWKEFFKENSDSTLSKEERVGLIGEIILLNQLLEINPSISTLMMWKGPFESKNDFVNNHKSLEVKTTSSKTKDHVYISSEYQLDTNEIDILLLAVIHLETNVAEDRGFTLIELINKTMLNKDELWKAHFKLALRTAGYDFDNNDQDENQRYSLTRVNLYHVNDRFPKISHTELAENISEVKYKLTLTGLEEFMTNKNNSLQDFLN